MTQTLGDYNLPIAVCTFFLRGGEWKPCGIDVRLAARHRSTSTGPIITAQVNAAVDGENIVAWSKPTYLQRAVGDDGTIDALDLTRVGEVLDASMRDAEAARAGAIGINEKLLDRKPDPQGWAPPADLSEKLYQAARLLIEQKVRGKRVSGVRLTL